MGVGRVKNLDPFLFSRGRKKKDPDFSGGLDLSRLSYWAWAYLRVLLFYSSVEFCVDGLQYVSTTSALAVSISKKFIEKFTIATNKLY